MAKGPQQGMKRRGGRAESGQESRTEASGMDELSLKLQKLRARRQGQPPPTRKITPKTRRPSKYPKREAEQQE